MIRNECRLFNSNGICISDFTQTNSLVIVVVWPNAKERSRLLSVYSIVPENLSAKFKKEANCSNIGVTYDSRTSFRGHLLRKKVFERNVFEVNAFEVRGTMFS